MNFKAPQLGMTSKVRVTFWDPETDERIPAILQDGTEFWGGQWYPNMITDTGLDRIATESWDAITASFFVLRGYLRLSGGMPEIKEPSGLIEAAQSGVTVTATGSFFAASDVGKAIVWADGSNARITAYTSGTVVTVDKTQVVAQQTFERWHVDIATIPSGITHPSGSIPGGSGFDTTDKEGGFWVRRSGLSRLVTLSAPANVNGFALTSVNTPAAHASVIECIRDASGNAITVPMLAGKAIRVDSVMEARIPATASPVSFQIDEYDAANQLIDTEFIDADFWLTHAGLSDTDLTAMRALFDAINPYYGVNSLRYARLLDAANQTPGERLTPATAGFPNSQASTDTHHGEYTNGTYRRTKEAVIPAAASVGAAHGIAFPFSSGVTSVGGPVIQFRNGATFTKANTHTLRVGVEVTWDRDYSN